MTHVLASRNNVVELFDVNRARVKKALLFYSMLFLIYSLSYPPQIPTRALPGSENSGVKHVKPIKIGENVIPRGSSKTYSFELNRSLTYHVYMTGPWVEEVSEEEKTDYDIYVYNPFGVLETLHTEAAGLPEHLGTTVEDPYFQPKYTGNYDFKIVNDPKESEGAQNATLMVIEHIETDRWYRNKLYMRGKDPEDKPTYFTTWAYEFVTSKPYIEILIEVPTTLDMYEARLFFMANPSAGVGYTLSGAPIPPYKTLYNETLGDYGGYNLDSSASAYRGNAFASCEYPGQFMNVTFYARSDDEKLYHLVFIAETGEGHVNFIIKTDFTPPEINEVDPINETIAGEEATISLSATDEESGLDTLYLFYTVDGWETSKKIEMPPTGQDIYVARIPGHHPGVDVEWRVEAFDMAGNTATLESSFRFRGLRYISCEASPTVFEGGSPVAVSGEVNPPSEGEEINLQYYLGDIKVSRIVTTNASGGFTDAYTPEAAGEWLVLANWSGGESYFNASSSSNFRVERSFSHLSIQVEDDEISKGESISISGELIPPQGDTSITLTYTDPDGISLSQLVTTYSSGEFYATYTPDKGGVWSVQASWDGGQLFEPSKSNNLTFKVKAKFNLLTIGILIAGVISAVVTVIILIRRRAGKKQAAQRYDNY